MLDPTALTSIFKTSDVTIETYEGTGALKAINASAEDKTADVIKGTVEFGVKVASMAAGVPAIAGAAGTPEGEAKAYLEKFQTGTGKPICKPGTAAMVAAAQPDNLVVKQLTDRMAGTTKRMDAITARFAVKLTSTADRERFVTLQEQQIIDGEKLDAAKAVPAKAAEPLTFTEMITWPINPFETSAPFEPSPRLLTWLDGLIEPDPAYDVAAAQTAIDAMGRSYTAAGNPPSIDAEDLSLKALESARLQLGAISAVQPDCTAGGACLASAVGLNAALVTDRIKAPEPCSPGAANDFPCRIDRGAIKARDTIADAGLFIRPPGRARLILCETRAPCIGTAVEPILETKMVSAPQTGQLRFIRFSNGPFRNNGLSIALRTDGSIEKLQYAEKSAVAATAAARLNATAATLKSYQDEREKARADAVAATAAAVSGARTEQAAVRADAIAELQYQIDQLTKQKQLLALQTPTPAEAPIVSADILNETTRINAQVAQLQARIAQLKAEQELATLT
ncbi:FlxA-like family protein [Sphingomonas sp. PB2P19]|uniref:FlxA-like family protein n=1 Tax=Sphingomonas rhamnosi TaxID=3096156 RepID=UPI002FC88345